MAGNKFILTGMNQLANTANANTQLDFMEIEKQMIDTGAIQVEDPGKKFNEEMDALLSSLNMNGETRPGSARPKPVQDSDSDSDNDSENSNAEEHVGGFTPIAHAQTPKVNNNSGYTNNNSGYTSNNSGYTNTNSGYTAQTPRANTPNNNSGYTGNYSGNTSNYSGNTTNYSGFNPAYNEGATPRQPRSELEKRTVEQQQFDHINKVMNRITGDTPDTFSITQERLEDVKTSALEEIDALWQSLTDQNIDLSGIKKPTRNDSIDEIENVRRVLGMKNDRVRYCGLAEEGIMVFAYLVETVFNGDRIWFGKFRPNMTGWHKNVNVKLKRMQYETSSMVTSVMKVSGMGPLSKILLELVPNAIMYGATNTTSNNKNVEIGDIDRNIAAIRNM